MPPPELPPSTPRKRRFALALVVAGLAITAAMVTVGGEVLLGAREIAKTLISGGHFYWSDDQHGWTEIPLALRLRRHWGEADVVLHPSWTEVQPGIRLGELSFLHPPDPRGVDVLLVAIDPRSVHFRVFGRDDWRRGSVKKLAQEAGLTFAVNGSYFSAEGPLGLVVSDAVVRNRQGTRRAAHFLVDAPGRPPRIVNEKQTDVFGVREGFQGFPAIMSDRHTFSYMRTGGRGFDVDVVDRRTAACIMPDESVLFMVTDTWIGGLSLSELATVEGALGCVHGMAFDGGASSGMWIGATEREVRGLDEVPVVVGVEALPADPSP